MDERNYAIAPASCAQVALSNGSVLAIGGIDNTSPVLTSAEHPCRHDHWGCGGGDGAHGAAGPRRHLDRRVMSGATTRLSLATTDENLPRGLGNDGQELI
jgi:hypothetical protein